MDSDKRQCDCSAYLGLWDQESGEDTAEHEKSIDLHDVVEPGRRVGLRGAAHTERTDEDLGDDGADLSRGGGDTVRRRPVASREALAGYDEGSCVRAEVEEELAKHVAGE